MRTSSNESGRSLIEMLGTIAIITMITIGGIAATRVGLDTFRANSTADQIEQVAQGVLDLYSWKKNFNGVGSDTFWTKNCGGVYKPCTNGKFDPIVGDAMSVTSFNNGFKITVTNIPSITCRALVGKDWAIITDIEGTCPDSRFGSTTLEFIMQ